MSDYEEVYQRTFRAHNKWKSILLALGVCIETIHEIRLICHDDLIVCYFKGLKEWLKTRERSWRDLVEALSIVGHSDIAKEIERDYIQSASSPGVTSQKQMSKLN